MSRASPRDPLFPQRDDISDAAAAPVCRDPDQDRCADEEDTAAPDQPGTDVEGRPADASRKVR
jgi:hypothetical protein